MGSQEDGLVRGVIVFLSWLCGKNDSHVEKFRAIDFMMV